jgi:tetratricopeptide (TPR) repeat protein
VDEVLTVLGPWADPAWANQHALEIAQAEVQSLSGIDQYFAQFNEGTSHVNLLQYADAAAAFDRSFNLYANLLDDGLRPYRIVWYQTWPYWAYYYTGRYQDVINLADTTLNDTISEPVLEESFYWRALAREALGDLDGALADFRQSVALNPNFGPGWDQLARLGAEG